ncbi:unnamed protein product [Urochloa humidicola]
MLLNRSLRSTVKSTAKINSFPLGPYHVSEEQGYLEVPFESLTPKKSFSSKDSYKSAMKLHSLRLGGLVGTKCGEPGCLTYGTSSKDNMIMVSIRASTPVPPSTSHSHLIKSLKIGAIKTAGVPKPPPVVTVTEPMMEVPFFALMERRTRAGFKGKMAASTIRRGGLFGDKKMGDVGFIVYGTYEVEDHLQL